MSGKSRLLFAIVAVTSGLLFWWHADWWAYAYTSTGIIPKFIMPLWYQVIVSGVVGIVVGLCLVGPYWLFRWVRYRFANHRSTQS